jgi:hypothetical protein
LRLVTGRIGRHIQVTPPPCTAVASAPDVRAATREKNRAGVLKARRLPRR